MSAVHTTTSSRRSTHAHSAASSASTHAESSASSTHSVEQDTFEVKRYRGRLSKQKTLQITYYVIIDNKRKELIQLEDIKQIGIGKHSETFTSNERFTTMKNDAFLSIYSSTDNQTIDLQLVGNERALLLQTLLSRLNRMNKGLAAADIQKVESLREDPHQVFLLNVIDLSESGIADNTAVSQSSRSSKNTNPNEKRLSRLSITSQDIVGAEKWKEYGKRMKVKYEELKAKFDRKQEENKRLKKQLRKEQRTMLELQRKLSATPMATNAIRRETQQIMHALRGGGSRDEIASRSSGSSSQSESKRLRLKYVQNVKNMLSKDNWIKFRKLMKFVMTQTQKLKHFSVDSEEYNEERTRFLEQVINELTEIFEQYPPSQQYYIQEFQLVIPTKSERHRFSDMLSGFSPKQQTIDSKEDAKEIAYEQEMMFHGLTGRNSVMLRLDEEHLFVGESKFKYTDIYKIEIGDVRDFEGTVDVERCMTVYAASSGCIALEAPSKLVRDKWLREIEFRPNGVERIMSVVNRSKNMNESAYDLNAMSSESQIFQFAELNSNS